MISIDQRIYIVFIGLAIVLFRTVHYLFTQPSVVVRIGKFLQLLVLLFPFLDFKLPPAELNFKLFDVAILAFTILNFNSLLKVVKPYITRFTLVFFGIMVVLAFLSEFVLNALLFDFRLVFIAVLLLFIRVAVENGFNVYKKLLVPVLIWAIVFFVLQLIYGVDFTLYQTFNEVSVRDLRYTSFAQDPQKLAQIVFMIAIIFLGRVFQQQRFNSLKDWAIVIACISIGLATGARAGLLGFGIAFILLYLDKISVRSITFLAVLCFAGFFVVEWLNTFQTFQRMNEVNDALEGRMQFFWLRGFLIFRENFWFGVGPGNFLNYVTVHHSDFTYGLNGAIVDQPESGYLLWLCELGVTGTACYLLAIIFTMVKRTKENGARPFKLALVVWLVGFITVYSLSDVKVLFLLLLCMAMVFSKPNNVQIK